MTKTNHPLIDLLNQNFLMITNYRGVIVSKVSNGYSVIGKRAKTPQEVDDIIDQALVHLENSLVK